MFDRNSALFKALGDEELESLAKHSRLKVLSKHQYLCTQYTDAQYVYIIASGAAVAERVSSDGRRQVLSFIFPGDVIGLTYHHEFSVKSLTPLTSHQFRQNKIAELSEKYSSLSDNLSSIRERVIALMLDQLYLLGQKKAHERVCFLLLHLLKRLPGASVDNIELPMTRLDMADYLGLTVETVSRSITKLKAEGLIETTELHSMAITDLETVTKLADIN
ncbi:MAG: Crp/Fnr family transcriptional regulator [Cellvibrionaceae bacterium]|nr:Crp/Fnr family transcriptional regulator [Cellvibrionaceae bacterium]